MRVLHFSSHYRISSGIVNQIAYEKSASEGLQDVKWDNVIFTCQGQGAPYVIKTQYPFGKVLNYVFGRLSALIWLAKNAKRYDFVILRHNLGDPFEFIASFFIGRYVTMHHTLEMAEAKTLTGAAGRIQSWIERVIGKRVLEGATGIVGVTREIAEHEQARISRQLPTYIYPNGIDLAGHPTLADDRDAIPRFLFVAAQFTAWHGLDQVIVALAKDRTLCEVHVVGYCSVEQLDAMAKDPRFISHGELSIEQIRTLSTRMDVGLSSLALERKGMKEACTLKVREYLAGGLPVYSGHIDAALPSDFPFYQIGQPSLEDMIGFAKEMRGYSRAEVREAARPYISKAEWVKSLANWLRTLS
jgi:hypothetical protein